MFTTSKNDTTPLSRSNIHAVAFYIVGSEDIKRDSHVTINNKNMWNAQTPVVQGLYDPHLGTTELAWYCQTCLLTKQQCPGHAGMYMVNYPLQNPAYRREIIHWLRCTCHTCGQFVNKKDIDAKGVADTHKLSEYVRVVRTGGVDKIVRCVHCNAAHLHVHRDKQNQSIIWRTSPAPAGSMPGVPGERLQLYNNEIATIFNRIPNENVLKMGKKLDSHPKKLILSVIQIPSTVIRPEIRKIGGNRSTMNDITGALRNIIDYNSSIPRDLPKTSQEFDKEMETKTSLIDQTIFEMIIGSSGSNAVFKLQTTTNRASNSISNRLSKKHGRLRANLMGKRVVKMARSVITGDKALRPDQVGVPKVIAKNLYIRETVHDWNRAQLMVYFLNGTQRYPGCNRITRVSTGRDHYVNLLPSDYVLATGDVVYRQMISGDSIGFNY